MNYEQLERLGATVVKPLQWHADRPKVFGCMFGGSADMQLGSVGFYLEMWWHGPEPEDMTDALAKKHTEVRGIRYEGKYHDVYWYAIFGGCSIWLHRKGWFQDKELREIVERERLRTTINIPRMQELGFVQIV